MRLLDARALSALLVGSFAVATACGSDRQFSPRASGGSDGGEAGDSSEPIAGTTNHAGNGGSSHVGGSGSGAEAGTSEEGGTAGEGGAGAITGEGGASGEPGMPPCGAPGAACCAGNSCVTNATCKVDACACAPNYSACGGSCFDLKSDPKNCGACGHDCLGGTCDTGICQPTTVATAQLRLSRMATDGTYLYWSGAAAMGSPYYVARVRVDGTGGVKVLAPSEDGAGALAVTPDKVYWISKGQLRSCAIPDCTGGPVNAIMATTTNGVSGDMLYEPGKKALYWSRGAAYGMNDGSLYNLASGAVMPTIIGTNPSNPGALVSDATNVYWINSSTYTSDQWNADGGLWRVRANDATTATQIVSTMKGDISYLAVSGSALFFSGNIAIAGSNPLTSTTAILSAPLPNGLAAGTQPPKFADAKSVHGLYADSKYVYFADDWATGTISRCAVAGCATTAEIMVPGLYSPNLGAQDATSLYFAFSSSSAVTSFTIQRLAK